jgi:hypothetical protein
LDIERFAFGGNTTMSTHERYIALFDILGFKHFVEDNLLEHVAIKFRTFLLKTEFTELLSRDMTKTDDGKLKFKPALLSYRVFSDTIITYTADTSFESLYALLRFCSGLLYSNFMGGLMLRGAITRGDIFIDDEIIIGKPIVQAYSMERQQEWIGCWIADECIENIEATVKEKLARKYLVQYAIPLKSGVANLKWALNWAAPFRFSELLETEIAGIYESMFKIDEITWDVKRKFDNTSLFLSKALPLILD